MRKIIISLCLLYLFSLNLSACEHKNNNLTVVEGQELSSTDKALIEEYNMFFDYLRNGDEKKFHESLKKFLGKVELIQNSDERNNILMNIYMQLGMNKEAYELNEKLIIKKPMVSRFIFRCQLMDLLKHDEKTVQRCHAIAGSEIFKVLDKTSPTFEYDELAYFIEMYKGGYHEYHNKIKTSIEALKDEDMKAKFLYIYEGITGD